MILLLDCGSDKTLDIARAIDEDCDYKIVPLLDFEEKDLEGIKGIVISGAPLLITEIDMDPYLKKVEWIKETKLPVLGICFGHQLLGMLFGAQANRMREDRDWQLVEAFEDCILFDRLPQEVEMMEDHCETTSIPPGFQLVASSDACVNEAMQHLERPLFGVQFHPEVSGNHGRVLISNFVNSCLRELYP